MCVAETANCRCDVKYEKETPKPKPQSSNNKPTTQNTEQDQLHGGAGDDILANEISSPQNSDTGFALSNFEENPSFDDFLKHFFGETGKLVKFPIELLGIPTMVLSSHPKAKRSLALAINKYGKQDGTFHIEFRFSYDTSDKRFGNVTPIVRGELQSTRLDWIFNGELKVFDDTFDFNSFDVGVRNIVDEMATRIFEFIRGDHGKEFDIRPIGAIQVTARGRW